MIIRLVAVTMLAAEIAIHADLAPAHLREIPYIGVGFVLASLLLTLALLGVLADRRAGWLLGTVLCAGMAALFVLSRTIGLPGMHEQWSSDDGLGLASLPPEAVFLLCAISITHTHPLPATLGWRGRSAQRPRNQAADPLPGRAGRGSVERVRWCPPGAPPRVAGGGSCSLARPRSVPRPR